MHIVGTAGHVDHGKSALVLALTGTDPDRLAEEKLRGMTLDLGFAPLRLAGGVEAGIVDVPGHERFLHNMLAGAAGMELLLLVVAANEGPRQQTMEHLAILDLLGVPRTIVVLTKSDLVTDGELQGRRDDVAAALRGTVADDAPIYAVSTVTGQGLDELRAGIADALRSLAPRDVRAPAYLPIDRVFALAGHGTIVTGTLMQGSIAVGDALHLSPGGRPVRVRSLQVFGERRDRVDAGSRVAVNLPGVERSELARGAVLADANLSPRSAFDVEFVPVVSALPRLRRRTPVRAYIGAAELLGTLVFVAVPTAPGGVAARLHLRTPAIGIPGGKFIVRRPSPKNLLGGGTIGSPAADDAHAGDAGDDAALGQIRAALAAAGLEGADAAHLGAAANLREDLAAQRLEDLCEDGRAYRLTKPSAYVDAAIVDPLRERIRVALEDHETRLPWMMGATSLALARSLGAGEAPLVRILALLVDEGAFVHRRGYFASPGFEPQLSAEQRAFFARELPPNPGAPLVPASNGEIVAHMKSAAVTGLTQAFETLLASGALVKIGDDVYRSAQIGEARRRLEESVRRGIPLTPASLRDALGTSRKYVVPMLEWFDAVGVTVRSGDARVLREGAPAAR